MQQVIKCRFIFCIKEVRATAAIRAAEAFYGNHTTGVGKSFGPMVFKMLRIMTIPAAGRGCVLTQIIDMPAFGLVCPTMT